MRENNAGQLAGSPRIHSRITHHASLLMAEKEFQQRIQKIEALVRQIESLADPAARASALELFQLVMDLHGASVERMMNIVFEAGEPGQAIIDNLGRDDLVGSLLLLY